MNAPTLPAWLQDDVPTSIGDKLVQNLGSRAVPYLSIMGGRLTLIDAGGDEEPQTTVDPKTGIPYIDVVIIDANEHASKIYFGKPFDPNGSWEPPKCWSDNGVAPSVNAAEPQAKTCTPDPTNAHGCKWAVWGSATSKVTGKGIPACSKQQKLAFIIPGDDMVWLLRVPPNSLDNLATYSKKFSGTGVNITQVITRISFEAGVLGTLTFIGRDYADAATTARKKELLARKATDQLVGRGDQPIMLSGPVSAAALPQANGPVPGAYQPGPPPGAAAPQQAVTTAEPPKRRRGRPAAAEQTQQPAPQQAQQGQQPPFPTHGVVENASAPDPGLTQSLAEFFKP